MLKKKYNLFKQLFLKYNFQKIFFNSLLTKSFAKNHFIAPLIRISFFSQPDYVDNFLYRFKSYQKLQCLISLSPKVHSKKYHYARFFLNKQLDKLTIANTLK